MQNKTQQKLPIQIEVNKNKLHKQEKIINFKKLMGPTRDQNPPGAHALTSLFVIFIVVEVPHFCIF